MGANPPSASSPLTPSSSPVPVRSCGLAVASLVLGVVGLGTCILAPLLGIPAVICGHIGLARIDRSQGLLGGRGLAIGGLVTGYLAVASILVLPALLLPAVSAAREKARQASCMANLKQIGLGVLMYAQDYNDVMPADLGAIRPYTQNDQILSCPSSKRDAAGSGSDYAYFGAGLKVSRIKLPAQTVIAVDSAARHNRGTNILYADGHVKWVAVRQGQDWRATVQARGDVVAGAEDEGL